MLFLRYETATAYRGTMISEKVYQNVKKKYNNKP